MFIDIAYWRGRAHDRGRADLGEPVWVYFTSPAVIVHPVLGEGGVLARQGWA